jgi:hypothetical protein
LSHSISSVTLGLVLPLFHFHIIIIIDVVVVVVVVVCHRPFFPGTSLSLPFDSIILSHLHVHILVWVWVCMCAPLVYLKQIIIVMSNTTTFFIQKWLFESV